MTPQEIKRLLAQTLDDRRMSRGERRAMANVLDDFDPSDRSLAVYRSVAFDLAREALSNGEARSVLDWLEEAVKLFQSESDVNQQRSTAESLFSPADDCPGRIVGLLARASRSVDICVFTITDNRISSEILATQRRGVPVRIISDDDKANDRGSDVDRLAEAGVRVRVDRTQYHMHHKFAVFDERLLLTGSYNWTRGAAEYNEENFIITSDQHFVHSFSNLFGKLWSKFEPL